MSHGSRAKVRAAMRGGQAATETNRTRLVRKHSASTGASTPLCTKWCSEHARPWMVKCSFLKCGGCDACAPSTSAPQRPCPVDSALEPTLTMCCRNDGFGSQYMALISVYAFSVLSNRTFCASPFDSLAHFTTRGHAMLLDAWDLYNFVGGPKFGPAAAPTTPMKYNAEPELLHAAPDAAPYHKVAGLVRQFYDSASRKPALHHFQRGQYNVVLHVRAGDVGAGGAVRDAQDLSGRSQWTPLAKVASCVRTVMQRAPQNAALHVFSQGNLSDFGFLAHWKPSLHIEVPTDATIAHADSAAVTSTVRSIFHHMVEADSLITARSSLSLAAGFLSRGRVFSADLSCSAAGRCVSADPTKHFVGAIIRRLEPCVEGRGPQ